MLESTRKDIDAELERARAKFPGTRHVMNALTEEVGELASALLEHLDAALEEAREAGELDECPHCNAAFDLLEPHMRPDEAHIETISRILAELKAAYVTLGFARDGDTTLLEEATDCVIMLRVDLKRAEEAATDMAQWLNQSREIRNRLLDERDAAISALEREVAIHALEVGFINDPDVGFYRSPPRESGEVRKHHAEYFHNGGWSDAVFIEDDDGFRWLDVETGDVYPLDESPSFLAQYYYRLPWVTPSSDEKAQHDALVEARDHARMQVVIPPSLRARAKAVEGSAVAPVFIAAKLVADADAKYQASIDAQFGCEDTRQYLVEAREFYLKVRADAHADS